MDVENQIIRVRMNNFNEKHFSELGYVFNKNDYIEIPVKDLPSGSGFKIDVECNYCKKTFKKAYRRYLETKNDICCDDCRNIKMVKTSIERYGSPCSLTNKEVSEKTKRTNMEKYGCEYCFQNKDILRKGVETSIKRYGHAYKTKSISKQQRHFHKLYGGILNYSMFPYSLDIFFEEEKIYFEYDGSGHKLGIKWGIHTEESFMEKEERRVLFLKNLNYKEFRIISSDDVLPSDNELINIKDRAFFILISEGCCSYIFDLNTKTESFE